MTHTLPGLHMNRPFVPPKRQRGAILVVTLMFLLVVTMLAITALGVSTSEERMAGNLKDWNIAMQAAEAALRDAEFDVYGVCSVNTALCVPRSPIVSGATLFGSQAAGTAPGTCNTSTSYKGACLAPNSALATQENVMLDISSWKTSGSTTLNPVTYGTYTGAAALPTTGISAVSFQPQYIIEAMSPQSSLYKSGTVIYRITARGWGRNPNTQVTLQSIWQQPSIRGN
jgi:type IV pilus assembly protein PilX